MKKWRAFCSGPLGAMLVKEMRQGMRRGIFVVPFIAIQFLAVLAVWAEYESGFESAYTEFTGALNVFLFFPGTPWFAGYFWLLAGILCVLVMPLGGLLMMREELEEGNHELLLLTRVTRWDAVCGKFLALWGLIMLTFSSLLPYVLVRYFSGGWDTKKTLALAGTVVLGSALACAVMIGVSSYRHSSARLGMLALFGASLLFGGAVPLAFAAGVSESSGVIYHLNALAVCLSYGLLGLGLAWGSLQLSQRAYQTKPRTGITALLFLMPICSWVLTALTVGFFGSLGLLLVSGLWWHCQREPKTLAPSPGGE